MVNDAASYFKSEHAFATLLYKLALKQFGDDFVDWEAETTIISLHNTFGELPIINQDKILALKSLEHAFDGRFGFFNEVNCFRHTINALNNIEPDHDSFGALIPEHIHWGIYEISLLHPEYHLDEEPAKMLGLSYHHAGLLLLPDDLSKYQEFLDMYNKNTELVPKVKEHWKLNRTKPLDNFDEDHDFLDQQVFALRADASYMANRKDSYMKDQQALAL